MNAQQLTLLARRLEQALQDAGIHVERADVVGGNVQRWVEVPAEGVIGRWLQNGWKVWGEDGEPTRVNLQLEK